MLPALTQILGSATAASLIVLVASVLLWLRSERTARKLKVGAVSWAQRVFIERDGKGRIAPEINIDLYNGLQNDVGIHGMQIYVRTASEGGGTSVIVPTTETFKAQH